MHSASVGIRVPMLFGDSALKTSPCLAIKSAPPLSLYSERYQARDYCHLIKQTGLALQVTIKAFSAPATTMARSCSYK